MSKTKINLDFTNQMKKTFLFSPFFVLLIHHYVLAQNSLTAQIILTNNDTLNEEIMVSTNLFRPTLLNESSINERIIAINSLNKKHIIKAGDIKKMTFEDFKKKKRIFVGISWRNNDNRLKELLYDGKIKWYREYNLHPYDGSTVSNDIMINEENEKVVIRPLNSKKNMLKEITRSKPELAELIENTKMNDENILMILKKYEE